MKIRAGFVSNSSSSSFCVFGVSGHAADKLKKLIEEKHPDECASDVLYGSQNNVEFHNETEKGSVIGVSLSAIMEDDKIRDVVAAVAKERLEKELGVDIDATKLSLLAGSYYS